MSSQTKDLLEDLVDQLRIRDKPVEDALSGYGQFEDYCWNQFDENLVCALLLDKKEHILGHKEILFHALCAWIASPLRQRLQHIRDVTAFHVAERAVRIDEQISIELPNRKDITGLVSSFMSPYRHFTLLIFLRIGGIAAIRDTQKIETVIGNRRKWRDEVYQIVRQVAIFHFIYSARREKVDRDALHRIPDRPSKFRNDGIYLTLRYQGEIQQGDSRDWRSFTPSKRKMDDINRKYCHSTAFIYAASQIRMNSSQSLLSHIMSGTLPYDVGRKVVRRWFGMTAFVQREILADCHKPNSYLAFNASLPDVKPMSFEHPLSDPNDQILVRSAYKR